MLHHYPAAPARATALYLHSECGGSTLTRCMQIRLKKTSAGVTLACVGDDGRAAVQRTGHRGFFAYHDLLHYAVETTLGLHEAFFGLMAAGWSFENFTRRDDPNYRPLPHEAQFAEHLVGLLSLRLKDLASPDPDVRALLAEELNHDLTAAGHKSDFAPRPLTAADLGAIHETYDHLLQRWSALAVGDHLELSFPPGC